MLWHGRFRRRRANKHHKIIELITPSAEELLHNSDMMIILAQRVLKMRFMPVHDLGPTRLIFTAEYPARHVLGLDNENAKP